MKLNIPTLPGSKTHMLAAGGAAQVTVMIVNGEIDPMTGALIIIACCLASTMRAGVSKVQKAVEKV